MLTPHRIALWLSGLLVVLLVLNSKVRYDRGDTMLSLLTSQALLEKGSIDLREYEDQIGLTKVTGGAYWMFGEESANRQIQYNYPIGTSILAMPFVGMGRLLGMDMVLPHDDVNMQRALCALTTLIVFLLLIRIAGHWLPAPEALAASLLFLCGTTLISTMNGALWSHNTATIFACLILLELLRMERSPSVEPRLWLLGFLLFMAWLCRPTTLSIVAVTMGWVAWRRPRQAWKMLVSAAACFGLFVVFSLVQYSRWIPKYYDPSWWKDKLPLFSNIPEYLFSPARGLFTFTPLLLLMFSGYAFSAVRKNLFYHFLILSLLAHLILLSRHKMWFGGWSYGPRFFTELMPFCFAALLLCHQAWKSTPLRWPRRLLQGAAVVFTVFGLFVHTWQGLFNSAVYFWEGNADFLKRESYVAWNWRFPQFMASGQSNELKRLEMEWLTALEILQEQTPEGSNYLLGEPNAELFSLVRTWNRKGIVGTGKVYNHMKPLLQEGVKDFYCYPDQLKRLEVFKNVTVEQVVPKVDLGTFLELHRAHTVLLSIKDEGSLALSPSTREVFRGMGSSLDSLRFRDGYIACVNAGKLAWEDYGHGRVLEREFSLPGCGKMKIVSAGKDDGDRSEIHVLGLDRSMHQRGMNAVVIGEGCKVIAVANFDTAVLDEARGYIYHAHVTD